LPYFLGGRVRMAWLSGAIAGPGSLKRLNRWLLYVAVLAQRV